MHHIRDTPHQEYQKVKKLIRPRASDFSLAAKHNPTAPLLGFLLLQQKLSSGNPPCRSQNIAQPTPRTPPKTKNGAPGTLPPPPTPWASLPPQTLPGFFVAPRPDARPPPGSRCPSRSGPAPRLDRARSRRSRTRSAAGPRPSFLGGYGKPREPKPFWGVQLSLTGNQEQHRTGSRDRCPFFWFWLAEVTGLAFVTCKPPGAIQRRSFFLFHARNTQKYDRNSDQKKRKRQLGDLGNSHTDSKHFEGSNLARETHTVDGRNPAPPKKPWNDDSHVNTNKPWFQPWFQKWCDMDFVRPQYGEGITSSRMTMGLWETTKR